MSDDIRFPSVVDSRLRLSLVRVAETGFTPANPAAIQG